MKVFVVDDSELPRDRVADLVEDHGNFQIVGQSDTIAGSLKQIKATQAQVLVLDIHLKDGSGIDLLKTLKKDPAAPLVIILRNPSSVIFSLSEMVKAKMPDDEIINGIYISSERLLTVLNNTTALAHVTLGERLPQQQLAVSELVNGLLHEFSTSLEIAQMKIELDIPEDLQMVANPVIAEVIKNYISNAIKYARSGKVIQVEARQEPQALRISVKDFGETIPEIHRRQVFHRTVQLEAGEKRGRGLGLAIVKRIADAHGGEAWVEPNTPRGNIFSLRIPTVTSTAEGT
jgi:signal transduction histidine kinase